MSPETELYRFDNNTIKQKERDLGMFQNSTNWRGYNKTHYYWKGMQSYKLSCKLIAMGKWDC